MIIQIDLSFYINDARKYAMVDIDFEKYKTIQDVINYIFVLFDLELDEEDPPQIFANEWFLASKQCSRILMNVSNLRLKSLKETCERDIGHKAKKTKVSDENESKLKETLAISPMNNVEISIEKRKHKKKKKLNRYYEVNEENNLINLSEVDERLVASPQHTMETTPHCNDSKAELQPDDSLENRRIDSVRSSRIGGLGESVSVPSSDSDAKVYVKKKKHKRKRKETQNQVEEDIESASCTGDVEIHQQRIGQDQLDDAKCDSEVGHNSDHSLSDPLCSTEIDFNIPLKKKRKRKHNKGKKQSSKKQKRNEYKAMQIEIGLVKSKVLPNNSSYKNENLNQHIVWDKFPNTEQPKSNSAENNEPQDQDEYFEKMRELMKSQVCNYFKHTTNSPIKSVETIPAESEVLTKELPIRSAPDEFPEIKVLSMEEKVIFSQVSLLENSPFSVALNRKEVKRVVRSKTNLSDAPCSPVKSSKDTQLSQIPSGIGDTVVKSPKSDTERTTVELNHDSGQDESAQIDFIGIRPKRTAKRGFSSLGGTLKQLKLKAMESDTIITNESNGEVEQRFSEFMNEENDEEPVSKTNYTKCISFTPLNGNSLLLPSISNIGRTIATEDTIFKDPATSTENVSLNEEVEHPKLDTPLCSTAHTAVEEKQVIGDIECYPLLQNLPKPQDLIALKTIELDEAFCPVYSEFRTAFVLNVDALKVFLKFTDKFSMEGPLENIDFVELTKAADEVEVDWSFIHDPRLIYSYSATVPSSQ